MHLGARNLLILNPRDIPAFIQSLRSVRFTTITGVNTLFNALLNHPDFAKLDFSNLRTALGGGIILPYLTASTTVGAQFSVLMFTAVVLGGLGSVLGAVIGGIAVGVIQSLSAMLLPMQLQNLVLFAVFILVLALRPEGLLKKAN